MKGAGTHLHIIRLQYDAALIRPVFLQGEDEALEGGNIRGVVACWRVQGLDLCLLVQKRASIAPGGGIWPSCVSAYTLEMGVGWYIWGEKIPISLHILDSGAQKRDATVGDVPLKWCE